MTPTASLDASSPPSRELYPKLKPGPGRTPEEVVANQRARLRGAMIELAAERGYERVTVRGLSRLAGVSTGTFYKHFPNTEHCFVHTYEWLMRQSLRRAHAAQSQSEDWEAGIRAALRSILDDLAGGPKEAQLVLVEAFAAGPAMQLRMRGAIGGFERLLAMALNAAPDPVAAPPPILRGIAGGVMRVARTRLLAGHVAELGEVTGELGDWMLSLSSQRAPSLEKLGRRPAPAARADQTPEDLTRLILGDVGDEEGRILAAVVKLTATDGFSRLTIPRIRAEAGVSRRRLDARFASAEECFLAAIEATTNLAATRVGRSRNRAGGWEEKVDRAIRRLCGEIARNPILAHLAFAEVFAPGRAGLHCRERLVSLGATHLRAAPPLRQRPNQLFAEASSAAAWRIVHAEIAAGRAREAPRLAPALTYVALAPIAEPHCREIEDID